MSSQVKSRAIAIKASISFFSASFFEPEQGPAVSGLSLALAVSGG